MEPDARARVKGIGYGISDIGLFVNVKVNENLGGEWRVTRDEQLATRNGLPSTNSDLRSLKTGSEVGKMGVRGRNYR